MSRHPHRRIVTMRAPIIGWVGITVEVNDDEANIDHRYVQPIVEEAVARIVDCTTRGYSTNIHNIELDELVVDLDRGIEILKVDSP